MVNRDKSIPDGEELLDMEIALYFLRLIDAGPGIRIQGIMEKANEAMKKMKNPDAKKLLRDKIKETLLK